MNIVGVKPRADLRGQAAGQGWAKLEEAYQLVQNHMLRTARENPSSSKLVDPSWP